MNDVTLILSKVEQGDASAADQLLPLIYTELRKLAAVKMAQEKPGQTLQATALVHEAYVRLVEGGQDRKWESRGHFFAAAAEAIRRILIEQARRKACLKAGGKHHRRQLSDIAADMGGTDFDLLELNEAIDRLEAIDPRAAKLVKLRFFVGLTRQEAADAIGVSIATADNDWAYAKGWLQVHMSDDSATEI